jgi:hypothetical protein
MHHSRPDKWQMATTKKTFRAPKLGVKGLADEIAAADAYFWAKRIKMEPSMTPREYALTKKNDKLTADLEALEARLGAWQACATRMAQAYRTNNTRESTRALAEYSRLLTQEEGKQ